MQINWTEVAGLLAFGPAALVSAITFGAVRRNCGRGQARWATITAMLMLLFVEILENMRFLIGNAIRAVLHAHGVYSERRPVQAAVLLVFAVLAAMIARKIVRTAPDRWSAVASGAMAAVVAVFITECISLHAVDQLFYSRVGPALLIGWLWLAFGAIAAIAAVGRLIELWNANRMNDRRAGSQTEA